jgi:hypothetical protein
LKAARPSARRGGRPLVAQARAQGVVGVAWSANWLGQARLRATLRRAGGLQLRARALGHVTA